MNVMNSPVDLRARDDHLKELLGQRAARADPHGRYPSLSEFSDSPSVYSHPHFSPRPPDRPFLDGNPHSFRFPQSPKVYSPSLSEPRSPITDRERLNFPNSSSLDLEDDPRSSSELNSLRDEEGDSPPDDEDEEEISRITQYGPKMRFHSPAPWEEDGGDMNSAPEEPPRRSKKKSETGKKGWGLSRSNGEPRPSNDSSRSGRNKQSFDNSSALSANGALAALAQASMSSTSLGVHQSPHSLRDKLSLPRLRSRTSSNVGNNDVFTPVHASPVSRIATPTHPDAYGDERSIVGHAHSRSGTPPREYAHPYAHPYANPDLARTSEDDQPPMSPNQLTFGAIRGDSSATITDTTPSSSISQFRSTATFSMTPGTSTTSMNPSLNESTSSTRFVHKGISSPMPIDKASLHPDTLSKLNGFQQSPATPMNVVSPIARNRDTAHSTLTMGGISAWENSGSIKLISLEEAQAQARERSRSQTAHPAISSAFPSTPKTSMHESDLDVQAIPGRARSSSAGGKGRGTFESTQRYMPGGGDSPISGPTRQVGRKKSGFMRLFNGKDRISPSSPPPPVPMFSTDAFAANPLPPPSTHYGRSRQGSIHRVPVPSLSPILRDEAAGSGSNGSGSPASSPPSSSTGSAGSTSSGLREQQQLSVRRKVPELSIVTSPSLSNLTLKVPHTAPLSAGSSDMSHHHLTPTTAVSRPDIRSAGSSPSSAPPTKTDFVGLSIRPISTLFTRDIKDLAVSDDSSVRTRPSLEVDTGTPTTATTAISPLSPDFPIKGSSYSRSSDEKSSPEERDPASVIQALQEQILSTRRAWQRQIWELEGQVRDLKAEVEELRAHDSKSEYCAHCGRGGHPDGDGAGYGARTIEDLKKAGVKVGGVVNRPRARTGVGSRFASGT